MNDEISQSDFDRAVERFREAVEAIAEIAKDLPDIKPKPPTNTPHDPALRKDRRKWGGR